MKHLQALLFTLTVILFIPLITGCAFFRETAIKWSEEDLKNAETSREVARNLLSTWPLNSGFIRGHLGSRIDTIPLEAIKALDDLDALTCVDPDRSTELGVECVKGEEIEYSDYQLGYSLGLRVRMLAEIVKAALEKFAPEVLKGLPFAL